MQINLARLPDDVSLLQQLVRDLTATVEGQEATLKASRLEIARLKLQLARLRRQQFGQSSERLSREIDQLELKLEDLEATQARGAAAEETATARLQVVGTTGARAPRKPARRPLPEHLPREEVVHAPACTCPKCGGKAPRRRGEG